ncbi:Homocysteine S-methyltransferase [Artemisia annua]|uniref:Homocysteine S-methyltransferase n=1 Tax=Artemisia annua TaxID=35608 RepID=A0A2U1N628_ARTAN|nr:Homocysteine S-methyltransferase [Artemisia annua]
MELVMIIVKVKKEVAKKRKKMIKNSTLWQEINFRKFFKKGGKFRSGNRFSNQGNDRRNKNHRHNLTPVEQSPVVNTQSPIRLLLANCPMRVLTEFGLSLTIIVPRSKSITWIDNVKKERRGCTRDHVRRRLGRNLGWFLVSAAVSYSRQDVFTFDVLQSAKNMKSNAALCEALVEILEEGVNIPAWLSFNSKDGVNVVFIRLYNTITLSPKEDIIYGDAVILTVVEFREEEYAAKALKILTGRYYAATHAFVEILEEGVNIPAWLPFNSKDGVNVVSGDSLTECPEIGKSFKQLL